MRANLCCLFLLLLFSLTIGNTLLAQEEDIIIGTPLYESKAEFPGGTIEMVKYLLENLIYPETDEIYKSSGKIYVEFVITKDGTIEEETIVSGISPELDKEVLRVVKEMPKWNPAIENGVPVSSRVRIPITLYPF